jgi:hypothetical protein
VQVSDFVPMCIVIGNDSYDVLEGVGNSIQQPSKQCLGTFTSHILCTGEYFPTEHLKIEITSIKYTEIMKIFGETEM